MERHKICKICNKRFANGKAMGGHMRSHLAKLPLAPKPDNPTQTPINSTQSPPSSSSLIHDRESETESSKNPTGRRSKRRHKSAVNSTPPPDSVSSVSQTFLDTSEIAMCLLKLKRDKWTKNVVSLNEDKVDELIQAESDELESRPKAQVRFRCGTCKKLFRSHQALGGHKASHKRVRSEEDDSSEDDDDEDEEESVRCIDKKRFECPFCFKVFASGQALGGHKKVHFSNLSVTKISAKSGHGLLDLNLPAPEEDYSY